MADSKDPKDSNTVNTEKPPPPAYSEIDNGGAPSPFYDQGGYPPQPYMQGYHYPQPSDGTGKPPELMSYPPSQYPPGQYPPGQHLPGQYPYGQHPPGQYPSGQHPPGQYPPGQYPPGQYPPPAQPSDGSGKPYYAAQYSTSQYPSQGQYPRQTFPTGSGQQVVFTPGQYGQAPYGQPSSSVVVTQPSGATTVVAQTPPPDNMLLSVLACLFCFCPLGMFAIMYSCQAKSANENNDFGAALRYGSKAKTFAMISIVIGIIFIVLTFVLRLVVYTNRSSYTY